MSEEFNRGRRRFLAAAAMTVAATQLGVNGCAARRTTRAEVQLSMLTALTLTSKATELLPNSVCIN
jgi:hypothetical protein